MPAALNGSSNPTRMELLFKQIQFVIGGRAQLEYDVGVVSFGRRPDQLGAGSREIGVADARACAGPRLDAHLVLRRQPLHGIRSSGNARLARAHFGGHADSHERFSQGRWGEILPRPAREATLGELECRMHCKSERRRRQRTGEEHGVVVQRQALRDALAEPAGADEGGDGRGADVDHRRGLDARHDGFARERQLYPVKNIP